VQFKGSVRAPGDKDPGVRVVLEIDEYHLEIRRDSELIGRYYLADVEVARDIAERFILFLGDDEVEFLADDALQFAYGGVTAMQDGWLSAQKRKRRHRRAAEDAARRKDGEPPMEMEVPVARSLHVSDSDTIRSRRRQAGGKSPEPAAPERTVAAIPPAKVAEAPVETRSERRERKEAAVAKASPPVKPPPTAPVIPDEPVAPVPVERAPETPKPRTPAKPGAASGRRSRGGKDSVSIASRLGDSTPKEDPAMADAAAAAAGPAEAVPAGTEPEAVADTSLAARRKKITADAKPKGTDDLGRVRVPEPVSGTSREGRAEASATLVEQTRVEVDADSDDARFAQTGHHPSETSTGLLAKLRRQPKLPDDHIHKFKEAGSSVGLVRRVCIECAYVSIGSDDD
jgi:hypothetical protein